MAFYAGIGGDYGNTEVYAHGDIVINGGTVETTGGTGEDLVSSSSTSSYSGAGIGSGGGILVTMPSSLTPGL